MEDIDIFDPTLVIQRFLETRFVNDRTEKCAIAVETYETKNSKRLFRIVALLRKRANHAIVIFTAKKLENNSFINIGVIDVIPLNKEFKLFTDSSRSSGEYLPKMLIGEDFTLSNFDPLSSSFNHSPCNRNSEFISKCFQLEFLKDDFDKFSAQIENASKFHEHHEIFSSFQWLQKLRDEAESSSEISNEINPSGSENDLKTHSASSSPRNSMKRCETSEGNMAFLGSQNQTSLNQQKSSERLYRPVSKQPSESNRHSRSVFQSTPDLLNKDFISNNDRLSERVSDDRQYEYVENKLKQKENEYSIWEDHTLFVGTWNVNGRLDESICLDDWLCPPEKVKYPSFYAIGFQELDLSIGSVALNRGNMNNLEEKWLKLIETSTPFKKNNYKRLYRTRLSGILLVIYVIQKLSDVVSEFDVTFSKVPTGMFNVMGNKGAVGVRIKASNSNLCFINCHLAAGESNRLRRDQDFREIEKNLLFRDENDKIISLYNNDLVFLMGDLNYRLINIDATEARELINQKNVAVLISKDELINESNIIFKRFSEGNIEFMPSYKFDPYTDDYDTSEKNRIPSYCDRIMWVGEQEHCRLQKYHCHMSLKISDHKPVSAWFSIGLKKVDLRKRMKVQEAIIRSIDLIYNLSLPQAKVDKQEIKFDEVHFYEHRQASIKIKNIGQYEFCFRFKEIPGYPRIPDWLTVFPSEGKVQTGVEQELIFEIFINANNIRELNTINEVQCILVLELQGGKDYFLTVSADLVPSSFGLPLSFLVTLKNPIATLTRSELIEKCKPYIQRVSVPNSSKEFSTPKEIYVMLDYLMKHVQEDELFARPGSHGDIQVIREQIDVYGIKANFENVSVHSITETLLMFLNSLYFPIIPNQLMKECMGVHNNFMESVKVIGKLPQDHQNLFHYLTSFLRRVLESRADNGTDMTSLATLFVDLIFRPKSRITFERDVCAQFIKQFLINDSVKYFKPNPLPTFE